MRPDIVIVVSPERQLTAGVIEAVEQFFVQQLVPQAAVEALYEGVLLGFARVDVMSIDVIITGPLQYRTAGELCSIVADDAGRLSVDAYQRIQFPGHPCA